MVASKKTLSEAGYYCPKPDIPLAGDKSRVAHGF